MEKVLDLKTVIRDVPDFPKEGIIFKDITTLLNNAEYFEASIENIVDHFIDTKIDYIAGIESRGFIFGSALAFKLGVGFVPIRKKGKLPHKTVEETYDLEYGKDTVCIHEDAFPKGANVLLVDDLLATGGTAAASVKLLEKVGAKIAGIAFVIELKFLNGREKLGKYDIFSQVEY
mgnify:CR=1 FL=1